MSTQVTINDTPPKTQITATGGQTVFSTDWTANASTDVVVYARAASQEPNDLTQLVDTSDYTVAFIDPDQTVQVTFLSGRTAGDIITITRDTPADRLNLYTNTNFTASMLNQDIGILTLVDQQAQLYNNQVAPHYNVSSTPDLGDSITGEGGDIYLPVLGAGQIWVKNEDNTAIVARDFADGTGQVDFGTQYSLGYYALTGLTISPIGPLSNGQILIGATGNAPAPATISANTNVSSSVGPNSITISGTQTPTLSQINDTNGNQILNLSATANAVNYVTCANSSTGNAPSIQAQGSDANVPFNFFTKGTGSFNLVTANPTVPLSLYSGTASQHITQFAFANTLATRVVTFPDLTGTVALSGAGMNVDFGIMQCSSIYAPNGTGLINPNGVTNAVNFWTISNNATGQPVYMASAGSDTNIGQYFITKGDAGVVLQTAAVTTVPLAIQSGTSSQHTTNFLFSNTSATRNVTFPDATGTVQFQQSSPTQQTFTSGSGTYTTPAGVKYIVVEMVGGGAGGNGGGTASAGNGGSGGNTLFGSSLLTANGGTGAGSGGTISIGAGAFGIGFQGAAGSPGGNYFTSGGFPSGGHGGATPFAGGGIGGVNANGQAPITSTGAGGGGGSTNSTAGGNPGYGGSAGGYIRAFITSPSATYSYTVGAAGTGGTAGTNGFAGGAGAAGLIVVTEYYQ